VYDNLGSLRWKGVDLFRKLSNGNILYTVDEFNWLGKIVVDRNVPAGFYFHHDAMALPNGNIVALVDNENTTFINWNGDEEVSRKDYILELDAVTSEIKNAWDLREYLDVSRNTLASVPTDWIHLNSLAYDPHDDSIILSSRYQGILKITRNGMQGEVANQGKQLMWILSPRMDWAMGGWDGNGSIDPNDHLLTAVDANFVPYNQPVQDNLAAPGGTDDDFHWPVGQHGLRLTSRNGAKMTLLTFDNQASFIFDGPGSVNNGVSPFDQGDLTNDRMNPPYSLLIEYEIDEVHMTVRQKWEYGQNDDTYYGSLSCNVNLLSNKNKIMISTGYDSHDSTNNPINPHVIEFTQGGAPVLHLEVTDMNWLAYNGGKVDLFHPEH
jgi:arylsulfate sulfotransferase